MEPGSAESTKGLSTGRKMRDHLMNLMKQLSAICSKVGWTCWRLCLRLCRRLCLNWRLILAIALPIVLLPLVLMEDKKKLADGTFVKQKKFRAAYTIIIVALYWMLELMPLAVTSLLPLVLFPFLGVLSTKEVAPAYFKDTNVMFFAGLVLALGVEYCNLHKRIALRVMTIAGCSPVRLLLGVMFTSMFLSMWMSNTACCAMMLPIILAVLDQLNVASQGKDSPSESATAIPSTTEDQVSPAENEKQIEETIPESSVVTVLPSDDQLESPSTEKVDAEKAHWENVRKMFMFGTAYASNLGGTATITGTGPNLLFQELVKEIDVGKHLPLTFATWMALNVPASLINVTITYLYLILRFNGCPNFRKWRKWRKWPLISLCFRSKAKSKEDMAKREEEKIKIRIAEGFLKREYEGLGKMNFHEWGVVIIFSGVILLWIFRSPKFIRGWNDALPDADISDATAGILGVVLMFIIPKSLTFITGTPHRGQKCETLLDWKYVQQNLSWGVVLLLGGGFALSDGAIKSGLSKYIGDQLSGLDSVPHPAVLIIVMVLTASITEVCSNTATANVILPILIELSRTLKAHPFYLTIPATISCSFAFMLPVATPPNALVFGAGNLKIMDMVSTGLFLNFACVTVYFLIQISYGELLFGYSDFKYPNSTNSTNSTN